MTATYQTLLRCRFQDARCLVHLDHESAPIPVELISCSYSRENTIHDAHLDRVGGDEAPSLGEDGDDGSLAKEG